VVGDSVTTAIGLRGSAVESNPVAAKVLEQGGRPGTVLVKVGIVLGLYCRYYTYDRTTSSAIDDEAALFVGGIGVLVTAWNTSGNVGS
jgi:hypothetical protein